MSNLNGKQQRVGHQPRDACKIFFRVVRQFAWEQIDGVTRTHQQNGVGVRLRARHQLGGDYRAAAGAVFNNDLLAYGLWPSTSTAIAAAR